uniref:Uncharacterized protein n=1 Tax=Rhizophora mucronata TaxID=61149 RepID=A0A2P2PQA5_RHIMU
MHKKLKINAFFSLSLTIIDRICERETERELLGDYVDISTPHSRCKWVPTCNFNRGLAV